MTELESLRYNKTLVYLKKKQFCYISTQLLLWENISFYCSLVSANIDFDTYNVKKSGDIGIRKYCHYWLKHALQKIF